MHALEIISAPIKAVFQWCVFFKVRLCTYAQYMSMNEFTCSEHSVRICRSKKHSTGNQPLVSFAAILVARTPPQLLMSPEPSETFHSLCMKSQSWCSYRYKTSQPENAIRSALHDACVAYFHRIYISKGRFLKSGSLDIIGQFSGMECFARFSRR